MKKKFLAAVLAIAPAAACLAEDNTNSWSGEAELGFTRSTGNTDSENLLTRIKINKEYLKWSNELRLEAINSSEDDVRTKESYLMELQANRKFSDLTYAFSNLRHVEDKFGGFRKQSSVSFGMGWNVLREPDHKLKLESGLGYRRSEEQDTDGMPGETLNEPVFVGSAEWVYQLTETTTLSDTFRTEVGSDNTFTENEIAARVKINSSLGLKVSYLVRNNSDVPVDTEKTDTLTSISLDYKF